MSNLISIEDIRRAGIDIPLDKNDNENIDFVADCLNDTDAFVYARLRQAGISIPPSDDVKRDVKRIAVDVCCYYLNSGVGTDNEIYLKRFEQAEKQLDILAKGIIKLSETGKTQGIFFWNSRR